MVAANARVIAPDSTALAGGDGSIAFSGLVAARVLLPGWSGFGGSSVLGCSVFLVSACFSLRILIRILQQDPQQESWRTIFLRRSSVFGRSETGRPQNGFKLGSVVLQCNQRISTIDHIIIVRPPDLHIPNIPTILALGELLFLAIANTTSNATYTCNFVNLSILDACDGGGSQ
jgi:hypothetical protein